MLEFTRRVLSPVISLFILSTGSSLLGTLLPVRLEVMSDSVVIVGFLSTIFYAGSLTGSIFIENLILKIGLIRCFSLLSAIMAVTTLACGSAESELLWLAIRLVYGSCLAGIWVVIKAWMMSLSPAGSNGRTLSIYMLTFYTGQAAGQLLVGFTGVSGTVPFCVSAILLSGSVIPLALTSREIPQFSKHAHLNLLTIFKASPSGFMGSVASGILLGSLYGLMPLFLKKINYGIKEMSYTMSLIIFGGMLLQYPLGKLSDYFNRHKVLLSILVATVLLCLGILPIAENCKWLFLVLGFLFGGCAFTIYPLSISLSCDFVSKENVLPTIGGLLFAYNFGAIIGPFVSAYAMQLVGPHGLFLFFAASIGLISLFVGIGGTAFNRLKAFPHPPSEKEVVAQK